MFLIDFHCVSIDEGVSHHLCTISSNEGLNCISLENLIKNQEIEHMPNHSQGGGIIEQFVKYPFNIDEDQLKIN